MKRALPTSQTQLIISPHILPNMSHNSDSTKKFDHANVRSWKDSNGNTLHRSISLTPEMLDKMYFSPQN
jgi:hypothetical protein